MRYECRITVLEAKCFQDLQEKYLADPKSGPCPFFKPGIPSYLNARRSRTISITL